MYLDELPATNFTGKKLDSTVFEKVRRLPLENVGLHADATFACAKDVCGTVGTAV